MDLDQNPKSGGYHPLHTHHTIRYGGVSPKERSQMTPLFREGELTSFVTDNRKPNKIAGKGVKMFLL